MAPFMGNFHRKTMGILDDIQNGKPVQINDEPALSFDMLFEAIEKSDKALNKAAEHIKSLKSRVDELPQLRSTAPLQYLINERQEKQDMEDGTWKMIITIDTLNIDELVKLTDFANNVAYQNHRAHIIRSTPVDMFPGFRVKIRVGSLSSAKRIIMPCISKEQVMHSKEFLLALQEILKLIDATAS